MFKSLERFPSNEKLDQTPVILLQFGMKSLKSFTTRIIIILAVIAAALVALLNHIQFLANIDVQKQQIKNTAVTECLAASSVEIRNAGSVTVDPIRSTYKLCMDDKGYRTTYQEPQ